ncbi:MAG: putative DNA binding domain-containing protein, partial [Erysipelotrichaceae bacterium]
MIESNRVEFKSELNEKLEKVASAFLNTEGGTLYIGINDDGTLNHLSNIDQLQLQIADRLKNNILPTCLGLFDIHVEEIDSVQVIKVTFSNGVEKPYYIKKYGMSPNGCYIRVGAAAIPMAQNMIDDLYSRRVHRSLRNILSPRKSLTFSQLKIYYEEKGLILNSHFAESLELLTEDGKYNYLAYLLADENGVSIKVAKYADETKVDLIENEEYGYCSLIKATNRVLDKLRIENVTKATITDKERIESSLVDAVALREAVINAIIHNDYTTEFPPVFEIFSNRIAITSYGGLLHNQSKEEFFDGGSMPRNRELMRVFKDVGLVEQLGSGMDRILKAYDRSVFKFFDHLIKVNFPIESTPKS